MTVGEYARMLVGEKWVKGTEKLDMNVITCSSYDHNTLYEPPVRPSPNLKTTAAILCYPSTCFFEGTVVSVGRGTSMPFQTWGHPSFCNKASFSFTPVPVWGKPDPLFAYTSCCGQIVAMNVEEAIQILQRRVRVLWLIRAYEWYTDKEKFFTPFFEKLAGTADLRKQIQQGMTEEQIHASWKNDITTFKKIRKKYLLYPDFE